MEKFVPKPYKKEQITLRIDVDKLERMETLARRFEISRSEIINRCIDFAMGHIDDAGFEKSTREK